MKIIGHSKLVHFFDNALSCDKLSSAYCFSGTNQVGKRTLAKYIACSILQIEDDKLESHPDFYYLARLTDEKTGKKKKNISIEQVRHLKSKISSKAWLGKCNIVIINEAELLNKESGNALLKALEESDGRTIFFLLTTDDNALLATIRSRCEIFYLAMVSNSEITAGLLELDYSQVDIEKIIKLAWGMPGRAISLLQDGALQDKFVEEYKRIQKFVGSPFYEQLKSVEDLSKKNNVDKEIILETFNIWTMLLRGILRDSISGKSSRLADCLGNKKIQKLIDKMTKARVMLNQNVNPSLIMDDILLTFN